MSELHFSEQELIRREKLVKIQNAGINPFPAPLYPVNAYSADIKNNYTEETKDRFNGLCVAGRIMSINDKGKVFFIKIQDSKGIIQLYVRRDD
ncbi:OB-fold nucleic acid binding domain-containing protein, partial [Staphylococcus aureus]